MQPLCLLVDDSTAGLQGRGRQLEAVVMDATRTTGEHSLVGQNEDPSTKSGAIGSARQPQWGVTFENVAI